MLNAQFKLHIKHKRVTKNLKDYLKNHFIGLTIKLSQKSFLFEFIIDRFLLLLKKFNMFRNSARKNKCKKVITIISLLIVISCPIFMFRTQAGDNLKKMLIKVTQETLRTDIFKKGTNLEIPKVKETGDKLYKDFKSIDKDFNINILKPSYIPSGYDLQEINVSSDNQIRVTARYLNNDKEAIIYSIYIPINSNVDAMMTQEKIEGEVEVYNSPDGIGGYLFENINWAVGVIYDDNAMYSIYGIKSTNEIKKIIDGLRR